jgi:hypothetical protein
MPARDRCIGTASILSSPQGSEALGSQIDKKSESGQKPRKSWRLGKKPDRAAAGNLDQARIREIVLETIERVTGKRTDSPTVSERLERRIRTRKGAVTAPTMIRYEQIVRDLSGQHRRSGARGPHRAAGRTLLKIM